MTGFPPGGFQMEKLLNCLPLAIMGVMLFLVPNLTRRGILFAVPVTPAFFLHSNEARRALSIFRRGVAIGGAIALFIAYQDKHGLVGVLAPLLLILVAASSAFYRANRIVGPFLIACGLLESGLPLLQSE